MMFPLRLLCAILLLTGITNASVPAIESEPYGMYEDDVVPVTPEGMQEEVPAVVIAKSPLEPVYLERPEWGDYPLYKLDSVLFAPYESPFPVSIEDRFDGFIWHHPNNKTHHNLMRSLVSGLFTFDGYVKLPRGIFVKLGALIGVNSRYLRRVGIDVQFGKYWEGIGAVRFGLFADDPGIGGDFWVIYKNRFKWMTTLEISAFRDHEICESVFSRSEYFREQYKPAIKWLNRFFVLGTFYISCGVEHIHGIRNTRSATQGFIGFGSSI